MPVSPAYKQSPRPNTKLAESASDWSDKENAEFRAFLRSQPQGAAMLAIAGDVEQERGREHHHRWAQPRLESSLRASAPEFHFNSDAPPVLSLAQSNFHYSDPLQFGAFGSSLGNIAEADDGWTQQPRSSFAQPVFRSQELSYDPGPASAPVMSRSIRATLPTAASSPSFSPRTMMRTELTITPDTPSPPLSSLVASGSQSASLAAFLATLPQYPYDIPSDRDFLNERPDHAAYMFGFRVEVCEAFLNGVCPFDAYSCFHVHSKVPRRRRPLLQHGRYSYIPTRCRYLLEDRECPQGVHCRFAHVTEEVIYHPSKYKTQLCSHTVDKEGKCTGYGRHCAKAHGEFDRRAPVYEAEDGGSLKWTMVHHDEFVCPLSERDIERLFYMYVYKTRKCEGFPFNCACDGLDYHRDEERRRGPEIRYAPMPCPNVKPYLNAEWGDPNIDCSGKYRELNDSAGRVVKWDCEYAHTLLEVMYAPSVYKTSPCDHFDENNPVTWRCVWKRRCAHAHGKADLRSKEEAAEEWKQHLLMIGPEQSMVATISPTLPNPLQPLAMMSGASSSVTTPIAQTSAHQTPRSVTRVLPSMPSSSTAALSSTFASWSSDRPAVSASFSSSTVFGWGGEQASSELSSPAHAASPHARPQKRLSLFDVGTGGSSSLWSSPSAASTVSMLSEDPHIQTLTPLESNESQQSPSDSSWSSSRRRSLPLRPSQESETRTMLRSPSPSYPSHLLSAVSLVADSDSSAPDADTGLVSLSSDGRLSYDPQQPISSCHTSNDTIRTFAGFANNVHCGIKILDRSTFSERDFERINRESRLLLELSQQVTASACCSFTRYLDIEVTDNQLVLAIELIPTNIALVDAIAEQRADRAAFQPLPLIEQLFLALASLHRRDIVHGDITPESVTIDESMKVMRLGDIDRSAKRMFEVQDSPASVLDEARSRDVFNAASLSFYLLTRGRSPFLPSATVADEWHHAALLNPLDTVSLSPIASHFILHLLFTPAHQRWSAEQALQHPVFWPNARAVEFLCALSQLIDASGGGSSDTQRLGEGTRLSQGRHRSQSQPSMTPTEAAVATAARDRKLSATEDIKVQTPAPALTLDEPIKAAVRQFCKDLDELTQSICPTSGEWTTIVHNSLYERLIVNIESVDGRSICSLLKFVAAVGNHILHAPLLSCLVHTLFKLEHRTNCTRPRRHSKTVTSAPLLPLAVSASDDGSEDRRRVYEAVGEFFFARFPALLVSAFHLARIHLTAVDHLQPYLLSPGAHSFPSYSRLHY